MKYIKKIQSQSSGKSGMIILPMEWMKENKIETGDQVLIESVKDTLIIKKVK